MVEPYAAWATQRRAALHRLTPIHVRLEAQRCRHVAVAIPEVRIGGGIAACSRQ
jgi:hypothetical protein